MAIPSGGGSEVLKRKTLTTGTGWREIFSGEANHLYAVISLVFSSESATTGGCGIRINDGSNDISIVTWDANLIEGYKTFVWNDRLVLEEDDDLDVYNAQNGAWYMSYIEQDWT